MRAPRRFRGGSRGQTVQILAGQLVAGVIAIALLIEGARESSGAQVVGVFEVLLAGIAVVRTGLVAALLVVELGRR